MPGTPRRLLATAGLLLVAVLSGCSGSAPAARAPAVRATPSAATPSATTPVAGGPDAEAPQALAWRGCERGFECATLTVPLGGSDGTIGLAVTRLRATGARVGSLVVNPGGPGASAVDYLQAAAPGLPAVLRQRFDLVAVDPRGVGRSSPVRCATTAELDRFWALDPAPDTPAEETTLEQGNAALVRGCAQRSSGLLPHVSTADAAADLERLRRALGDPGLTYLGYSYGTSIGAAYLDAYPTHVRAMVLDGALDPALTWDGLLEGQSRGFDTALQALLADCEATRCAFRRAVTGDLLRAYDALAAKVDATPLPGGGGRTVGPGEFSLGVGAGLYDRAGGWPAVEAGLAAAERGDGRTLLALSDAYLERSPTGYAPVSESNVAVNCLDRPWPRDPQAYVDLARRVAPSAPRFGPAIALSGLPCATWPVPAQGTPHAVHAPGAPPVVVIGTTRDPATPYAWSVALAGELLSGVLLTHVGDGHTVYRAGAPACLLDPVRAYLVDLVPPAPATC